MKKFIKFIYYIFVKNNSYIEFYFYFLYYNDRYIITNVEIYN